MKKYHFYVTPAYRDGYLVCERGRGNNFVVCLPTKYRAQLVAKFLWKLWKNHNPDLDVVRNMVCLPCYLHDWTRMKNLMLAYGA